MLLETLRARMEMSNYQQMESSHLVLYVGTHLRLMREQPQFRPTAFNLL